jgi:hypothetical protein
VNAGPGGTNPGDGSLLDRVYPDLASFVEAVTDTLVALLPNGPDLSRVQFDSPLPDEIDAHGLFDPGPRILHLSPERTQLLRRLIFTQERTPETFGAFTTLVHELLHSASPLLRHQPAALPYVQSAGWAFWEEGLAAWRAQKIAGQLWFGGQVPPAMQTGWRSYQDAVSRMLWLEHTFGESALEQIWQQATTRQRIAVANDYLRSWLRTVLLENGMLEDEADALFTALGERLWELLERNYHLLLPQMAPAAVQQFLRGSFGMAGQDR